MALARLTWVKELLNISATTYDNHLKLLLEAATQMASGKLTPENAAFVTELAAVMELRANENMNNLAKVRSKQYGNASEFMDEASIFSILRPDSAGDNSALINKYGAP